MGTGIAGGQTGITLMPAGITGGILDIRIGDALGVMDVASLLSRSSSFTRRAR